MSHPWVGDIRREMNELHSIEMSSTLDGGFSFEIALDEDMVESLEERLENSQYDSMEKIFKVYNTELVGKTPEELKVH